MKQIVAFILFCVISTMVHAWGENCRLYHVHIKNTGTSDCVLKKHYILYGKVSSNTKIPDVIFRDKETQFEMNAADGAAASLLSYECGDDKRITFFTTTSTDTPIIGHYNDTRSAIIESKHIEASFESTRCSNFNGTANEITWTLTP